MQHPQARLWLAAVSIAEHLTAANQPTPPPLPTDLWHRCHTWQQKLELTNARGWQAAAEHCRQQLASVQQELGKYFTAAAEPFVSQRIQPRDLYDDLLVLTQEFPEVRIDFRLHLLCVTTESIELEDMNLGPFRLELDWSRLTSIELPMRVLALEPNDLSPTGVPHPHVSGERLCPGDGYLPLRDALQQGRLLDFFTITRQVLMTYNPANSYVELDDWGYVHCERCDYAMPPDDSYTCGECGDTLCDECNCSCHRCGSYSCCDCQEVCTDCQDDLCSECRQTCRECDETFCYSCLTEGVCDACAKRADEEPLEQEPPAKDATPAVHAHQLGQAVLSA